MRTQSSIDFENLFKEHYQRLVGIANHYAPTLSLAEEVVQDVFVDFWKKNRQGTIETPSAYLRRAVILRSYDIIKKEKRRSSNIEFVEDIDIHSIETTTPEREIISQENLRFLQDHIDELPERTREIFMLSRYEQMSYSDIAKQLNISPKTVEYHLSKALKILREAIFLYILLPKIEIF